MPLIVMGSRRITFNKRFGYLVLGLPLDYEVGPGYLIASFRIFDNNPGSSQRTKFQWLGEIFFP